MKFQFRIVIIFSLFTSSLNYLNAQNNSTVDSLIKLLKGAQDSVYIEICCDISNAYLNSRQVSLGFKYADSAMLRARKIKSHRFEAYAYNNFGNLYNYINDFTKALYNFEKALIIQRKNGNVPAECSTILNKGNTYFYSNEYNKAEKCYRKALQIYRAIKPNSSTESNIYINLGSACAAQDKYSEAEKWFKKSLEISKKNNDYLSIAYAYNNIGNTLKGDSKYNEAAVYFRDALGLKLKYGDNKDKADGYTNMAAIHSKLNDEKKALEYLKIGLTYRDTSIYNNDLKNLYKNFATTYEKLNDVVSANKYYKILSIITSEIAEKELSAQIEQNDMMNEFSKSHLRDSLVQASKIEKQKGQISRSNTIRTFLLVIVAVIIVFLFLLFKRYKVSQAQKEVISKQKELVDEKQKEIMDSIKYARRIQESLLPTEKYIERVLTGIKDKK